MKSRILSLLILTIALIITTSCTVSKRLTSIQTAPTDSLLSSSIDVDSLIDKYSKYDGVYLNVKDIYEHSATKGVPMFTHGDWKYHRIFSKKYLIINPDKQDLTTFTINLPPRTIINNYYLVAILPNKTINHYDQKSLIQEKNYDGNITYKFAIPGVKKGTIVEYGLDLSFNSGPLDYNIELQYSLPCENLNVEFAYPDWWKINTKKISKGLDVDYVITRNVEEKKKIISYKAQDIPAITLEPFSPFFNEVAKYLRISFTLIDLITPIEFYKSWIDVADDYKDYSMNKESFLSNKAGGKTEELIEGIETPLEKLDTIVSFIQNNISIADDNKDRSFGTVLKEKKGSVYEICGLTEAMLSEAELEADYLLVHSAHEGFIDYDFISYDQFQMPAIRTKIDSTYYVVIPYYKYLPIDYLPEYVQEQQALIVSNNKNVHGKFWEIPVGKMTNNNLEENYNITIGQDGNLNVKEVKTANGSFGYELREYFENRSEKEIEKDIREILTYTEGNIDVLNYEIVNKDSYKEPLIIKIEYTINNLVTITPEEILFQTGGLLSPSSKYKKRLDPKDRVNPIVIYFDQKFSKNIIINYPQDWTLLKEIQDINFKNEFGIIEGKYSYEAGLISIDQSSYMYKNKQPKEKIEDLLKISGSISELQVPVIVFTKNN